MENASKALLIAAAILIVIVLVGIGMAVLNSTGSTQQQAADVGESTAMQTFNAQFAGYLGTNRTAISARNLLILINKVAPAGSVHPITVDGIYNTVATIQDGRTYTISAEYDSTTGYINKITIN